MARESLSEFDKLTRKKIALNLKKLIDEQGLTQTELSSKLKIPASTLSGYFSERSTIQAGNLQKIADYFNVEKGDIDERYKNPEPDLSNAKNIILPQAIPVPIIGSITAGTPIFADENIEEYLYLDRSLKIDFCLGVKGDSMIDAKIYDGDIALFKKQPTIENGEIGAIIIDNEATLKKVYKTDDTLILSPCNADYEPTIVKEDSEVYIAGKLIGVVRKY